MRRGAWAFWMSKWRVLSLMLWLTVSGPALTQAHAQATRFVVADRAIVPLHAAKDGPPPMDSVLWQPAALPDVVTRPVAVQQDQETSRSMAWYRLTWAGADGVVDSPAINASSTCGTPPLTPDGNQIRAVYVPRAIGLPVQVWRFDAAQSGTPWRPVFDNQASRREQWNRPLLVPMSPDAWLPGRVPGQALTVAVGVPFVDDRFHAVSSLWVGPLSELRDRHAWRMALHLALPQAASIAMVTLGLMSLWVWVRRRKELAYLYFAAASIFWPLRNLHHFIDLPRDPVLRDWFWWTTAASVSWVMLVMYLFAFQFDARRFPKIERAFAVFVVASGLLTMPVWPYDALVVQHAANLCAALFVTAVLGSLAWHGGSRELKVVVAALLVSFVFAGHDWLLLAMRITPETIYLLPYGSMLVIGSFLYAAQRRFVGAIGQVESANTVLASKLADREREIEVNNQQLRYIESEQAVLLERQRLMRDMHDGVGSTLIATLRAVEHGAISHQGVAEMLRAAIEDLRLAIDSLEPIEHDLTTLLATLRTRVGRRLETAGLHLRWSMEDLPPLPWLDATQALQVLRLLQEALTNVIKHAGARTVAISASTSAAAGVVLVRIVDDGVGFDPAAASPGRGIVNMHHRARQLDGQFEIQSSPGAGATVSIRMPLHRPTQGQPARR